MTATAPIISYLPAGAVAPNEKAGMQFQLDMANDAIDFHQNGDDTDPACCTAEDPCRTRTALEQIRARISDQIGGAGTDPARTSPDPRPTSAGSTRRPVADPATERQIGLVRKLARERQTDQIGTYPARTLAEIQAGSEVSKSRASSLITALMKAPVQAPTPGQTPAGPAPTPAQIRLIEVMCAEQGREVPADLTKQAASDLISDLMLARTSPGPRADLEAGMYRTPGGDIYKVQAAVHGSGRLYAKKLVALDVPRETSGGKVRTHEFVYAAKAIYTLTADMRMTLDEAKRWGALYGTCCVCAATLTDEKSIANGIGPKCGGRV